MAHQPHDPNEKVVYVGDSRVRKYEKNNIPRDYSAYPGKSEAFVPNFLLKEWMVGAVVMVGYMMLVISHPSPLGYPADPTNTSFIPMPDWYFLFLYQLLKYPYAADSFILLGTLVIPGLAFGGLLLAPFLDTGKERRFYRRPIASSLMLLSIIAVGYLTVVSWQHYQHELEVNGIIPEHIKRHDELLAAIEAGRPAPTPGQEPELAAIVDKDDEGFQIYQRSTCMTCHGDELKGMPPQLPTLRGIGDKYSKEELLAIIEGGIGTMPAQYQQNLDQGLTDADIDLLADWLARQKSDAGAEVEEG
ncbi:menaquinol-cytochrome C reductase [Xylanibacillus composti]|uniref:Menaquinol-cytochrome c reductase cytochrome b/c subunit n=1 Tax=Xylanibacillus composti TaxID=1572762 RepID=A0A8J4GYJ7_9BACL|nr:c-type cytochrome [Xylanibacillus composti]MDT9725483.1 menaquinol-cytochrome C reductase [Xylanibacillus composti]GIQ67577.1 menaquinol-cytochrome c reductase cytochrome b/c subunit [Xylanibacillus composti]